jgi:hypothetical protein
MAQWLRHCPVHVQNLCVAGNSIINAASGLGSEVEQNTGAKLLQVTGLHGMHVKMN